jgi:hypothetical protein
VLACHASIFRHPGNKATRQRVEAGAFVPFSPFWLINLFIKDKSIISISFAALLRLPKSSDGRILNLRQFQSESAAQI